MHYTKFSTHARLLEWLSSKESSCSAGDAEDTRDVGSIPGLGRSLREGHGTHSSILAWRIPWTEEPGRLQSIGWQRVRHDWSDWAWAWAHILPLGYHTSTADIANQSQHSLSLHRDTASTIFTRQYFRGTTPTLWPGHIRGNPFAIPAIGITCTNVDRVISKVYYIFMN